MGDFDQSARQQHRTMIKRLDKAVSQASSALARGDGVNDQLGVFLQGISQTTELAHQIKALRALKASTETAYLVKLREHAVNDFLAFYEYMNPDEPPARVHCFMGDLLMKVERREVMRFLLSLPPGSGKSVYCSHYFPAWYLGRNPDHKYIQCGHSQDFAENQFGKKVRGIVDHDRYRDVFPGISLSNESRAAGFWALASPHEGTYLTKGVGQGISGFRGNIAGVDDPFASREAAESAATRQRVFDWFMADFTTRLLPNSPLFVVATRWHPDDLCGRLEQMTAERKGIPYLVVNLPALAEDDDPLGRDANESIWPEFYKREHYENLKITLPPRDWRSLYCGKPVNEDGGTVKIVWFQRYTSLPKDEILQDGSVKKRVIKRISLSVDCANKITQRADYTAVGVWIETVEGQHYLAHVARKRVEFNDLVVLIEDLARKWKADEILVEDKGAGTQYIQTRQGMAPAPVIAISTNNESKNFRFDGVTPMIEGGMVYLPERAGWLADYETELLQFPNGKHDDQVDMTSQYLARKRKAVRRGTAKLGGYAYDGAD